MTHLRVVLLAYVAACAAGQIAFDVALTTPLPAPAVAFVPSDFVGFSLEVPFAVQMLWQNRTGVRWPYVRLMQHLQSYSGAAGPNIRVGGNSADTSEWVPDGVSALAANNTYRITDVDLAALNSTLPLFNGSCVLGLNARSATPQTTAASVMHAVAAVASLGGLLEAVEVGNEPVRCLRCEAVSSADLAARV